MVFMCLVLRFFPLRNVLLSCSGSVNWVKVLTEAHECFGLYFWVDRGWPRCPPLSGCSAGGRPSLLPTHTDKQTFTSSLQKGGFSRTLSSSYHQSLPVCLLKSSRSPSAVWPLQEQYEIYKYTVIIWHKFTKKNQSTSQFLLRKSGHDAWTTSNLSGTSVQWAGTTN